MIWEWLYTLIVWALLILVGVVGALVWILWRLVLPFQLRWRVRSYYFRLKRLVHNWTIDNRFIRPVYLKANVAWHASISWQLRFYWRRVGSLFRRGTRSHTVGRAIWLKVTFVLWTAVLFLVIKNHSYFSEFTTVLDGTKLFKGVVPQVRFDGTFFLTLLGLPLLFLLWAYRDTNSLLTIENQRKDTNLKEFQQLQMWACGVVKDIPEGNEGENSRATLRIGAVHQLSRFLNGEHGESFVRPTFEMLKALLGPDREFVKRFREEMGSLEKRESEFKDLRRGEAISLATQEAIDSVGHPPWTIHVHRTLVGANGSRLRLAGFDWRDMSLAHIELRNVFLPKVQLHGTEMRGMYLFWSQLQKADFSFAEMQGARVVNCDLQGVDFMNANLTGASFVNARLQGASMSDCSIEGATFRNGTLVAVNLSDANAKYSRLYRADLRGATLSGVDFSGANLRLAWLNGADVSRSKLEGADLRGVRWDSSTNFKEATFDDSTIFGEWDATNESWINAQDVVDRLKAQGLKHIHEN